MARFTLAGACALMMMPTAGYTQTSQKDGPEQANPGISDIVVTATRREERLQKIPLTVTAVSGADIATSGIRELRSLTLVAPAFNGGRNQNVMQPSIRGVGSSGTSVGDESNVAVYVDGVYQADPWSTQLDLIEVDRVEILRGPQGTVFGRNATGGLINVITPDPSFEARGRIAARYGRMRSDADDYDLRAYVTGGLSDTIAGDLAFLYRKNDGYIRDLARGGVLGRTRVVSGRSKLLFEPSAAAKFILTLSYTDSDDQTASQQPADGNSAGAAFPGAIIAKQPWSAALDTIGISNYDRFDAALRSSVSLGGVRLETTSAYMKTHVHMLADSDASNILLGYTEPRVRPETLSQEIRLLSNGGGGFNWIVGAYAFHLDGRQPTTIASRASLAVPLGVTQLDPRIKTTSFSGFAEGTYQLLPALFLTLGGRLTTEKRSFSTSVNGVPLAFGTVHNRFDKFTYRGALRYEFARDASIYASYGTGFKSGVYNAFGTLPTPVDPETIGAAEIGVKADSTRWLRTNVAVYHYDYKNLQLTARAANNAFILQNAATAKIYGGEFEAIIQPLSGLSIRGSAVYTHAQYDRFPAAQFFFPKPAGGNTVSVGDASGNRLVRTPRYTFNLGGTYKAILPSGSLSISANAFHSGRVYYDFRNSVAQPSYTLVSGEIGYTMAQTPLTFSIFATNLTNAKVAQQIQAGPLGTYIIYERPRRVGIGAEYKF